MKIHKNIFPISGTKQLQKIMLRATFHPGYLRMYRKKQTGMNIIIQMFDHVPHQVDVTSMSPLPKSV